MTLDFLRYLIWSNDKLIRMLKEAGPEDWAAEVGGSFLTLRDKACHLFGAIDVWIDRIDRGVSPDRMPEYSAPFPKAFRRVNRRLQRFVDGLDESRLTELVVVQTLSGGRFEESRGALLLHLVNHSSFHRGQIIDALRKRGRPVEQTDYVFYRRERSAS